jgi:uncharacterized OB-fold protein
MWMSVPVIKSKPLELVFEIPISGIREFWDGLEQGEVFTTRCEGCKALHFPPVSDCPDCGSSKMEWVKLDGSGQVEAFTHVIARPASFQQHDPYTIVICRLVDGVKILAWLKDAEMTGVNVGMEVKLAAGLNIEGEPTYWFEPF